MPILDTYQFTENTQCSATYQPNQAPATKCRLSFTGVAAPVRGNIRITDKTGTVYFGALSGATSSYDITGDWFRVQMTTSGFSTQTLSFSCSDAEFDVEASNLVFGGVSNVSAGMSGSGDYGGCHDIVCLTDTTPHFIGSWTYS